MSDKKNFSVVIRPTITKTLMVEAGSLQEAEELAHQDFSVESERPEEIYKQETLSSQEVKPEILKLRVCEMNGADLDRAVAKYVQEIPMLVEVLPLSVRELKPLNWVVVDNPGMDNEIIVDEFSSIDSALFFIRSRGKGDAMKRLEDCSLTTEY